MKLTILGTGNATVSACYNTCYAISDEGKHFLVDAGGGNRILKVLKDTGIDMNDIHDIDVAFLPCNLPYTMTPEQLAHAAKMLSPKVLFPYHYGQTDIQQVQQLLAGSGIDIRIRPYQ